MDKAKAAVSSFLSKDGKHDTTVHETVNPAITNEHVTRTQHEEAQKVVDREVHQDHHHTSVQPVKAKEVLPEQHTHNMTGAEHKEFHHGDSSHIKQRLESEAAQFKNTREVGSTQHTASAAATLHGEHVHHHVHETIQPVIQKETIQPSVVHTTIPVHEVHHNEAKHHTASTLPAVSLDEFKKQGGALGGRETRTDAFAGEPRAVGNSLGSGHIGGHGASGTTSLTDKDGVSSHTGHSTTGHSTTGTTGLSSTTGHSTTGHSSTGTTGTGLSSTGHSTTGTTGTTGLSSTTGHSTTGHSNTGTTGTTGTHKASLMDKINPMKDSNGDGQAGFMK